MKLTKDRCVSYNATLRTIAAELYFFGKKVLEGNTS